MTSLMFNICFYSLTVFYAVLGAPLALLPSDKPLRKWISWWARSVRFAMKHIAGITIEIRGREHMPDNLKCGEAAIIASKHHSYIDAVLLYAEMPNIAAVAMAKLADIPFIGLVFRKLRMIMVDRTNGNGARHLARGASLAIAEGRPILIYPEGLIPPVGVRAPYKKGVWHLQKTSGLPVIPVATNIGLRWSANNWKKCSGHAVIEFLAPITPGKDAKAFMSELETRIEEKTRILLAEEGFETEAPMQLSLSFETASIALTADM